MKMVKKERFARVMESAKQALEHAEGKRELRTTVLIKTEPMTKEEVKALREKLKVSQAVFANYLNVSPKSVQAWEQGISKPTGAALRLLRIARKNPDILVGAA
jgi:putative transcriptional regulator